MANRAREIPFKGDDFKEVLIADLPHEKRRKWSSAEVSADHGR